jgi:hypothetical protein
MSEEIKKAPEELKEVLGDNSTCKVCPVKALWTNKAAGIIR